MLNDKVVVVTGASSGIGAALSMLLASQGAAVVLAARRVTRLNEVAEHITKKGGTCLPVVCDVTEREEAEHLIQTTIQRFGALDILVNNAGRGHFANVEETTDEMIQSMFAVNVYSLWYTTRPALRQMKKQGSGHIINIASIAGKLGFPYNSAYVAAKHACVGFTHALRQELVETGIHATVVCPAGVLTEWANVTEGGPMLPMFMESGNIAQQISAGRNIPLPAYEGVISPESVAEAIVDCIRTPGPEMYTHKGSREFCILAATDRAKAEYHQTPGALADRIAYERLKGKPS